MNQLTENSEPCEKDVDAKTAEQVKIASLQQELRAARNLAKKLGVLSFCAAILMIVGLTITFFYPDFTWRTAALILGILGAIVFPLGAVGEWIANKTKMTLTKKLEKMSIKISACPKCKKAVLQDALEVCPFCGSRLKP
jgi:hypothetical protein